ncbi:hypothetical protein [Sphingomonas sp. MMS24-J13]|uniref:hypothetical protein n=1 Tax=Sphingomonas sp. MMS24-J13 TaxID=3238686 RepID=UPI003850E988
MGPLPGKHEPQRIFENGWSQQSDIEAFAVAGWRRSNLSVFGNEDAKCLSSILGAGDREERHGDWSERNRVGLHHRWLWAQRDRRLHTRVGQLQAREEITLTGDRQRGRGE